MSEEIKATEETMAAEETVETKTNFLQKVGAGVKKHGKKIAVAGAAVIGIGLIVARAALKKNVVDDNYDEASFEDEDDFEAEAEEEEETE